MNDLLFTVSEVAKILKVDKHLIYALIKTGKLPCMKLGSLKIRKSSLENFLKDFEGMQVDQEGNVSCLDYTSIR